MKIEPGGMTLLTEQDLGFKINQTPKRRAATWDNRSAPVSSGAMNRTADERRSPPSSGERSADDSASEALSERADEQLMLDFGQGNSRAFEILYARHKGGLLRYFRRQCYSPQVSEELFQDTWMKVVKACDRYKPTAKFSTWLYTLAHNRLIDHYRASGRRVQTTHSEEDGLDQVAGPAHQDPVRQTELRAQTDRFFAALDVLPDAQREAFLLREEAGLSLDEIAAVTEVNRETAKSRLRYAVARLRRVMENDE